MFRPKIQREFTAAVATAALAAAALAGNNTWAETLAAQALSGGPAARLPPNLVAILGLAPGGQGLAVRQLVVRQGPAVHTFNVAADRPHRVVVMVVDEGAQLTVAYLLGRHKQLQRGVEYHPGEAPRDLPSTEARARFAGEARFWSGAARAPAPATAH